MSTYTAIILDKSSQRKLLEVTRPLLPQGWVTQCTQEPGLCHHMTVFFPKKGTEPPEGIRYGQKARVTVQTLAKDEKVMAAGVKAVYEDTGEPVPCANEHPHVTIGIKYEGGRRIGKPFQSNLLTDWKPQDALELSGEVVEAPL